MGLASIGAIWDLFRKGQAVDNPEAWKKGQITVSTLVPVILAVAHVTDTFGLNIKVDADTAAYIAGTIIWAANFLLTVTTSKTIGLPAKSDTAIHIEIPPG